MIIGYALNYKSLDQTSLFKEIDLKPQYLALILTNLAIFGNSSISLKFIYEGENLLTIIFFSYIIKSRIPLKNFSLKQMI